MNNYPYKHKRMTYDERQGESRVRENFMHGLVDEVSPVSRKVLRRRGFTLIELLIVIAVIAILAGLLLPSLRMAKETAKRIKCVGNLKQVNSLLYSYTGDYDGWIPASYLNTPSVTYWYDRLADYNDSFKTKKGRTGIYSCPVFPKWWTLSSTHGNYAMNEIFNVIYYSFVKVEKVQKPSSLAIFLDSFEVSNNNQSRSEFGISRFKAATDFGTYPYFYHLNTTNVIFFGGNCGSYRMTEAQNLNSQINNELWKYPYK
ncbi:MAG: hypothetical protein A2017_08100 [Lentisphaerae bacterium GWF2_44_16]|nr:MAG: hypothetical protein A2017_08100 [Lentisphaerae bacterium GWF2_44_16]